MSIPEIAALLVTISILAGILVKLLSDHFHRVFISVEDCNQSQGACNTRLCKEIDLLRAELREYRKEMDIRRKEDAESLKKIEIFMARIDQRLKDHKLD